METKIVHNVETGEVVVEQLSDSELAEKEQIENEHQAELQKKIEAQVKRQALLERLGITEEEAKLLLS